MGVLCRVPPEAEVSASMVKVGCCGFPKARGVYYERFHLVEVQQTFYKMPRLETGLKWREEAPTGFEFTLKASQIVTHPTTSPTYRRLGLAIPEERRNRYGFFQPTEEVHGALEKTIRFARVLRARVILFQCPASFRETPRSIADMERFFTPLKDREFLFAWEPRGGWNRETVRGLCADLGLIHCVDPFEADPLVGEPRYFRLHGGPGYRHVYTRQELETLARKLGGGETYVLFNNIAMFDNALVFLGLAGE